MTILNNLKLVNERIKKSCAVSSINLSKVKIVNIPYEGQPFQNELIRMIKGINPNAKIIGYMHAPPSPVPANLIYNCSTESNNGVAEQSTATA